MKPINDPLDDFEVVPHNPTAEEMKMMSARIREEKADRIEDPSEIDFFINSGTPSEEDFKKISEYIQKDKARKAKELAKKDSKKTADKKAA